MRFDYCLDLRELVELNRSSWQQRLKGIIVIAMGAASILLGAWMAFFSESDRDPVVLFVAGGGFIALGLVTPSLAGLGTWVIGREPHITLVPNSRGMVYTDKAGNVSVPWSEFTGWYSTPRLFVLRFGRHVWLVLPKRCLEPGDWQRILELADTGAQKSGKEGMGNR